ncbi:MAG: NAD(+) synthase [Desulfovibrionaceae bacterium]|nr:NAD(+) synthase [Desulfovibrionaceae bacterium]
MAVSSLKNLVLCQTKPLGFNLEENVKILSSQLLAFKDALVIFPPQAFCPLDTEKVLFKEQLAYELKSQILKLSSILRDDLELIVPIPWFKEGNTLAIAHLLKDKVQFYPLKRSPQNPNLYSLYLDASNLWLLVSLDPLALNFLEDYPTQAKLIGVLASWPYMRESLLKNANYLKDLSRKLNLPLFMLNVVGGSENLIYYGGSLILDPRGEILSEAPKFETKNLYYNREVKDKQDKFVESVEEELTFKALTLGLRDYLLRLKPKKVLIGLSGGLDSALVLALACEALKTKELIYPVYMPSPYNPESSKDDAKDLCANLGLSLKIIPITKIFEAFKSELGPFMQSIPDYAGDVSLENLQARIRGTILYTLANRFKGLVLNTSNKSEIALGYSTLYGDTVGALSVLGDLTKTQVYALAKYYNQRHKVDIIPKAILTKPPSAELRPNQKDTDSLPSYETLDPYLESIFKGKDLSPQAAQEILPKFYQAEFKRRQEPWALIVSEDSFALKVKLRMNDNFVPKFLKP